MGECKCPVCNSILKYDETKSSVYCSSCGRILPTQQLPSEKARNEQFKARNEELEQHSQEALRDQKVTDDMLDRVLPYLEIILNDQYSTKKIIEEIKSQLHQQNEKLECIGNSQDEWGALILELRGELKSANEKVASLSNLIQAIKPSGESSDLREMILAVSQTPGVSVRKTLSLISNSMVYEKVARIEDFGDALKKLDSRMHALDILLDSLPDSADPNIVDLKNQIIAQRTNEGRKKDKAKEQMERVIKNCQQNLNSVRDQSIAKVDPRTASYIRDTLKSCARDIARTNLENTDLGAECRALCKKWNVQFDS